MRDDAAGSAPGRKWFRELRRGAPSRPGLYLFPHGGGSAGDYRHWRGLLPDITVSVLQLPGRRDRFAEAPFDDISLLMPELLRSFMRENDREEYAFFGHSLGALLAYRLAVELGRAGESGPRLLAVSAWAPGGMRPALRESVKGTDAQLIDVMRELDSLPANFDGPGLRPLLSVLRADCTVAGSYADDGARVACPVLAYTGTDDPVLMPDAMQRWASRTPRLLGVTRLPGGHFYIDRHAATVADEIARHLLTQGRRGLAGQGSPFQGGTPVTEAAQ
jgi:surfactin synthase thioesterase subunit